MDQVPGADRRMPVRQVSRYQNVPGVDRLNTVPHHQGKVPEDFPTQSPALLGQVAVDQLLQDLGIGHEGQWALRHQAEDFGAGVL